MNLFHAIIRPLGDTRLVSSSRGNWGSHEVTVWSVAEDAPRLEVQSFEFSYESLEAKFAEISQVYIEPDGSFGWLFADDPVRRITGQITDDGRNVRYVELRGNCRWEDMSTVLSLLGWPTTRLAFQLLPESLLVSEQQFRDVVCAGR